MVKFIWLLIAILLLKQSILFSQRNPSNESERIKMNVVYQLGFIPIPAGELLFQTYNSMIANKSAICLELFGHNLSSYDMFYKYGSYQQTFIDTKTNDLLSFGRKVNQNGEKFEENRREYSWCSPWTRHDSPYSRYS